MGKNQNNKSVKIFANDGEVAVHTTTTQKQKPDAEGTNYSRRVKSLIATSIAISSDIYIMELNRIGNFTVVSLVQDSHHESDAIYGTSW